MEFSPLSHREREERILCLAGDIAKQKGFYFSFCDFCASAVKPGVERGEYQSKK